MSTTANQNLSLGKLRRAVSSSISNYTTANTSLTSAGGGGQTKMSEFSIDSVDNTLNGFAYVDEQTSENYNLTFQNAGSKFLSKIGSRSDNFTWTTNQSDAFNLSTDSGYQRTFSAGTISDLKTVLGSNLVTNGNFATWTNVSTPGTWTKEVADAVTKHTYSGGTPNADPAGSGSSFAAQIDDGALIQTISVDAYSTYEIQGRFYNTSAGDRNIQVVLKTASHTFGRDGANNTNNWDLFTDNFYTSGSTSVDLRLEFTGSAGNIFIDHITLKKWAGPQYNDQTVTITGKYNDDGQSDGYNDHATRYNTAISKVVEIQDTYGGQTVACFLPGSKVSTPSGDKNIEDLDIGDEVNTFNIQTLPDEDLGYKEWSTWTTSSIDGFESSTAVIDNYYFDYASHYHTIFGVSNTTGLNVQLDVTGEHELLIKDTDNVWKWMKAGNCKVGQFLLGEDKSEIIIDQITRVEGEVEVVNIDVEPSDVYLVNGVLVHNKGTNDAP
mgnify:FL=1|tara:strand:+ start:4925 stop:6409 length:1485 start_codon:yes stop_codon:yes gene_type:complete